MAYIKQGQRKMLRRLGLRSTAKLCVVLGSVLFLILLIYYSLSDPCGGYAYTQMLCKQFEEQQISGELCNDLCRTREVRLSRCFTLHQHRVFSHLDSVYIKVPDNRFDPVTGELITSGWFSEPAAETSVEKFSDMVRGLIEKRLGTAGDQTLLLQRILDMADVNRDVKISISEARTIWSLLQSDEFFMHVVLGSSAHVPAMHGFCGDVYALEAVKNAPLFKVEYSGPGVWNGVRRWFSSRGWPSWNDRAKLCVGLLELAGEMFEHSLAGTVFLCAADRAVYDLGYSSDLKYELRLSHLHNICTLRWIENSIRDVPCTSDSDCLTLSGCLLSCDNSTNRCLHQSVRPNIHNFCALIADFLSVGAPRAIRATLSIKLDKCLALTNSTSARFGLEHSVILTELQSLLWGFISYPREGV